MDFEQLYSLGSSLAKDKERSAKIIDKVVCNWEISDYIRSYSTNVHSYDIYGRPINTANRRQEGDEVMSPTFWHSGSSEWCVELFRQESELSLCFHLLSSQCDSSMKAEVKASLVTQNNISNVYPTEIVSLNAPQTSKKKHITYLNYDSHNVFMLVCEVSIPSEATELCGVFTLQKQQQRVPDDLVVSLGALLDSEDLADFVLCAGGKELKAHKAVLSARSRVFAAMLRHDTREAQSGRMDIQDVDADTLGEVLRYIYTGSAPHVKKMAGRLLVAADKYDLQTLKELCEVELAKSLSVDNAADTAVIALSHSCDFLKQSVVSFIKKNLLNVLGSDGWARATTHHTQIVVELNRLIADKSVKCRTTVKQNKMK